MFQRLTAAGLHPPPFIHGELWKVVCFDMYITRQKRGSKVSISEMSNSRKRVWQEKKTIRNSLVSWSKNNNNNNNCQVGLTESHLEKWRGKTQYIHSLASFIKEITQESLLILNLMRVPNVRILGLGFNDLAYLLAKAVEIKCSSGIDNYFQKAHLQLYPASHKSIP